MDLDELIPLSQAAQDSFQANPAASRDGGPTDFSGLLLHRPPSSPAHNPSHERTSIELDSYDSRHGKLITDPIHGAYRLSPACSLLFDTRQFQRLRRLKQLGMTYYVFPGASHNRFEHSLGTAHLAYKFANQLWSLQKQELPEIQRRDLRVVELAGLCHDLGHGPYSHLFDSTFLRSCGVTDWTHEEMSAKLVDYILDDNHIDHPDLGPDEVKRIKALITSGKDKNQDNGIVNRPGWRWLTEIVANSRNSIDVDKFDYLQRDAQYCGVKVACDFNRIMQFSKVIGDEICYKYTEYMNLYELFHARASMHRAVYTHKKAKGIEFMVVDALKEANRVLKITDKIYDPAKFVMLDDGLLELIENFDMFEHLLAVPDDFDKTALANAQRIIGRLRRRDLYKYVTDAPVPLQLIDRNQWVPPTPQDIVDAYRGPPDLKPRAKDIIVSENKINFAMENRNPLDKVHFFDYLDSLEKRKLRPEQISSMVVAAYEEKRLRVYSKDTNPKHVAGVHQAFEAWVRGRWGGKVECATPAKPRATNVAAKLLPMLGTKRARNLFGSGSQTSSQGDGARHNDSKKAHHTS